MPRQRRHSAPPGAIELRDTQITLICAVAGLSELERNPVQIGGYVRYPKAPKLKADRSGLACGPCFRGNGL
jgi:hypothetical protein